MLTDEMQLRPRYGEVDQMGYVYHANYVSYCHQARTELMRKIGIHDNLLESKNIMLPVISFDIKYNKPAHYDEQITIKTIIREIPKVRFNFEFEIKNEEGELLTTAKSTVVFVNKETRFPMAIPDFVEQALVQNMNMEKLSIN